MATMFNASAPSAFLASLQVVEESNIPLFPEAKMSLLSIFDVPSTQQHPFWIFEWSQLAGLQVISCSFALLLAGLLCSAGGIGGGGIYVTVLMVAGRLSPRDAVPLSKAIVFFGSLSSLVLNARRMFVGANSAEAQQKKALIDVNICRLVVPAALAGTLLGVLLNRTASDAAIITLLATLLVTITITVSWTAWSQHLEEREKEVLDRSRPGRSGPPDVSGDAGNPGEALPLRTSNSTADQNYTRGGVSKKCDSGTGMCNKGGQLDLQDICLAFGMLFVVVASGVARYHAGACWEEHKITRARPHKACHHPTIRLMGEMLENWMSSPDIAGAVMALTLVLPCIVCFSVMISNSKTCISQDKWLFKEVAMYQAMAVVTGALAGLVGIGGGLIFSPFFLIMGVEPAVAVATSSTCVIFTSSSTTLQYLFTDRIIMSLTLVYGIVNLIACYFGTAFVHFLSDQFAGKRSYVTGIVAVGVLVSAVLSLVKLPS